MGKEVYQPGQSPHERANAIRRNLTAAQAQQHTVVTTTGGKINHTATTPSQVSTPAPPAVPGIALSGNPATDVTGTSVSASGSAGQAAPIDHTHALGIVPASKGGTNTDTSTKAVGTVPYFSVIGTWAFLAPNTTTTRKFLRETGTGTLGQAPAWDTLVASDLPVFLASGVGHAAGAVPDPGASAGTTRYLREDATFAVPPTSGLSMTGTIAPTLIVNMATLVAGGDVVEFVLPQGPTGATLTWTLTTVNAQLLIPGSGGGGATVFSVDRYTGSGVFSATANSGNFTISAAATSFSQGGLSSLTGSSGDKVRVNLGTLGTSAAGLSVVLTFSAGSAQNILVMPLMAGFSPSATGADANVLVMPNKPDGTGPGVYTLRQVLWRAQTSGSSSASVQVETSLENGTFTVDQNTTSITLSSSANEQLSNSPTNLVVGTGDLIRANVKTLTRATAPSGWTILTVWSF